MIQKQQNCNHERIGIAQCLLVSPASPVFHITESVRLPQSRCRQGSTDSQGKFENLPEHLRDVINAISNLP